MSALALKIIACVAMLLDHIGFFWNIHWLRVIGRIAFPIFVYMIYNGYRHTSSKGKYALRLAIFAVGTQIPFNLFVYGQLFYNNGNVFFTLLAALLSLWSFDFMLHRKGLRWLCFLPTFVLCFLYYKRLIISDYGMAGIVLILVFYLFDHEGITWKLLTVLGFYCGIYCDELLALAKTILLLLLGREATFPHQSNWVLTQAYAGFALPFIFAYNGQKGSIGGKTGGKVLQYGFYLFYPLHMVVLYFLSYIF